jgi:opacity protein-like surface antigen
MCFMLFAASAFPQGFSFGVKGGLPATDAFNTGSGPLRYLSDAKRYTVGPMVELRLPFRLGVEFDALYKRLDYSSTGNLVDVFTTSRTTGNSWEFPLLLKYRLTSGPIKPYVEGGVSFNRLSGFEQFTQRTFFPGSRVTTSTGAPSELMNDFRSGLALGAGLDVHALVFHVAPEIRYTHWTRDTFRDLCCSGTALRSNDNQAEFLLGITF